MTANFHNITKVEYSSNHHASCDERHEFHTTVIDITDEDGNTHCITLFHNTPDSDDK
mgnify:FL=1|jgi:hypothetical protein